MYVGENGEEADDRGRGRGRSSRQPPKIDTLLREGQEIVVQVAKEPIGTKGARITSHISIAGRHLVLTPWAKRVGVSRRIDSDRERRRLRESVSKLPSQGSRLHHPHRRAGYARRGRPRSRHPLPDTDLGRHPDQEG